MRRTSDRLRVLASAVAVALAVVGLGGCGGPAAEVTVVLRPADGVTLAPIAALKLVVRDSQADTPEVFGPLAVERDKPLRLPALVPPENDFYLDVWGCPTMTACDPDDLVARGCTDVVSVPAGSSDQVLAVELLPAEDADCPPRLP